MNKLVIAAIEISLTITLAGVLFVGLKTLAPKVTSDASEATQLHWRVINTGSLQVPQLPAYIETLDAVNDATSKEILPVILPVVAQNNLTTTDQVKLTAIYKTSHGYGYQFDIGIQCFFAEAYINPSVKTITLLMKGC